LLNPMKTAGSGQAPKREAAGSECERHPKREAAGSGRERHPKREAAGSERERHPKREAAGSGREQHPKRKTAEKERHRQNRKTAGKKQHQQKRRPPREEPPLSVGLGMSSERRADEADRAKQPHNQKDWAIGARVGRVGAPARRKVVIPMVD
jgi:hypothetical protein